ncbi:hypothetical protein L6164_001699 [Bauhinia variegata]|uniref:Uncharacterized protein n=1 Tax=Bauhinia variegata TaxID=167791 RepID=A0ACB9QAC2_BAUVA|nr:hypothetical protein L6164_001699 [Bauhinia variegata]
MATLQRFKLLATQCGVAPSPTRSPRTSPLVQLRRRKTTLRMLFSRSTSLRLSRRRDSPSPLQLKHLLDSPEEEEDKKKKEKEKSKDYVQRNSLKELFVSSPPKEEEGEGEISEIHNATEFGSAATGTGSIALGGSVSWRDGSGSPKPGWTVGFRCRSLLRKTWRPMLLTIPE